MTPMNSMTADRPASLPWVETAPEELDVAVVGGGFSGLLTLVHLRRAHPRARLALFERRARCGPGVAYGACGPTHLLNVPAGRMGAFPDEVAGFHRWLESRWPGRFTAGEFVPRRLYGEYLVELAISSLGTADDPEAAASPRNTWLVRDAVVHIERLPTRFELLRASGSTCVARGVVLAPGLPQARAPWTAVDQGVPRHLLVSDPWEERGYEDLVPEAPVLVVGSGLTAVDVVLELRRRGHCGSILMLSRNGRLPLPHALPGEPPEVMDPLHALVGRGTDSSAMGRAATNEASAGVEPSDDSDRRPTPSAVFRAVRAAVRRRRAQGLGWEAVIDALRPRTTEIWRGWTSTERRSFLRRLRPFWEIHRHRAPRDVLATLEALRVSGVLSVERGAIVRLEARGADALRVTVSSGAGDRRSRPDQAAAQRSTQSLEVARLFNCVGPAMGVRDTIDPLLGALLRSGVARPDDTGMGFECDDDGRLISAGGVTDPGIVLVGALRRGTLWESTAVPELRVQAKRAAEALGEVVAARTAAVAGAVAGAV